MSVRNAIFVDVENMNVLYKVKDRFVSVLSYVDNVERLSEMAAVLGTGYDIYLCVKPHVAGDGDMVLDELSIVGMPFTAKRDELVAMLKFFHGFPGVNTVYMCNWVHNYVASARVRTFDSVFYYGDGVMAIEVVDNTVYNVQYWEDQASFNRDYQVTDETYGDVGLLDVDGVRAQFSEVSELTHAALTAIAPVMHCYHTPVKLNTDELYNALIEGYEYGSKVTKLEAIKEDPALQPSTEVEVEQVDPSAVKAKSGKAVKLRGRNSIVTTALVTAACMAFAVLGATTVKSIQGPVVVGTPNYYMSIDSRVEDLEAVTAIYTDALTRSSNIKSVLATCQTSGLELTIVGFEYLDGNYSVRYNCVSPDQSLAFVELLGDKYTIVQDYTLGVVVVDGQQVQQYQVVFHFSQ